MGLTPPPFTPDSRPGILHHYVRSAVNYPTARLLIPLQSDRLTAFEHHPKLSSIPPENHVIFIAGLSDGLITVPYTSVIADSLPESWSLVEVLLSSAYSGWGTSSLSQDAKELDQCIRYFQNKHKASKTIIMGHSTGCQVCMKYLVGEGAETRAEVQAVILQASVSDREAMGFLLPKHLYERGVKIAQTWVEDGRGEDVLPEDATEGFFHSPCCARRWLSLASPDHDGDDDYFSSDLSDEQLENTFGKLPKRTPLLLCYSEKDQYVPEFVEKEALIKKWRGFVEKGGGVMDDESGLVKGASHNLIGDPDEVVKSLAEKVVAFVGKFTE